MENETKPAKFPWLLILGCSTSAVLLISFSWMQTWKWSALDLKAQWLWVAVLPVIVVLIAGKYVGKLKFGDYEVQFKTDAELSKLQYIDKPSEPVSKEAPGTIGGNAITPSAADSWTKERAAEYQRSDRLFLVHVCELSSRPDQLYDVTIFLIRHVRDYPNQRDKFEEIEKLELYLGESWNHAIFTFANNGGPIGLRTSAWGSFLATGRVVFKDSKKQPLVLHRYVDFEMAPKRK